MYTQLVIPVAQREQSPITAVVLDRGGSRTLYFWTKIERETVAHKSLVRDTRQICPKLLLLYTYVYYTFIVSTYIYVMYMFKTTSIYGVRSTE